MAKDLFKWDPENESFWENEGKSIAWRTLWISIPCLLCGFAVWIYWSVITVQMLNLGFPFSKGDLFTLNSHCGA
jgi:NNP family nitrate/nitrite transporter-like MFS transporter